LDVRCETAEKRRTGKQENGEFRIEDFRYFDFLMSYHNRISAPSNDDGYSISLLLSLYFRLRLVIVFDGIEKQV